MNEYKRLRYITLNLSTLYDIVIDHLDKTSNLVLLDVWRTIACHNS